MSYIPDWRLLISCHFFFLSESSNCEGATLPWPANNYTCFCWDFCHDQCWEITWHTTIYIHSRYMYVKSTIFARCGVLVKVCTAGPGNTNHWTEEILGSACSLRKRLCATTTDIRELCWMFQSLAFGSWNVYTCACCWPEKLGSLAYNFLAYISLECSISSAAAQTLNVNVKQEISSPTQPCSFDDAAKGNSQPQPFLSP